MLASLIGAALKAHLSALAFTPAIPVAWPNRDFTPNGERFIAAQIEANPNDRLTIGGAHRVSGSLLVTVVIPLGGGTGQADGIADAIAAHFPCDLRLVAGRLRITAAPSVRSGFPDDTYWRLPLVVPFEVLAA